MHLRLIPSDRTIIIDTVGISSVSQDLSWIPTDIHHVNWVGVGTDMSDGTCDIQYNDGKLNATATNLGIYSQAYHDLHREQEKIESEYEAARNYPEELRRIRNGLLAVCDWTQNRDVTLSNNADWVTYRQQLRDLPATITNANTRKSMVNNRSHSSWPTKPS